MRPVTCVSASSSLSQPSHHQPWSSSSSTPAAAGDSATTSCDKLKTPAFHQHQPHHPTMVHSQKCQRRRSILKGDQKFDNFFTVISIYRSKTSHTRETKEELPLYSKPYQSFEDYGRTNSRDDLLPGSRKNWRRNTVTT